MNRLDDVTPLVAAWYWVVLADAGHCAQRQAEYESALVPLLLFFQLLQVVRLLTFESLFVDPTFDHHCNLATFK